MSPDEKGTSRRRLRTSTAMTRPPNTSGSVTVCVIAASTWSSGGGSPAAS